MVLMDLNKMQEILQELDTFIYIRDDTGDMKILMDIMSGNKVYETRPRDVFAGITANGKNQYRKRIGLLLTHRGYTYFFGDCILVKVKDYHSNEQFMADYEYHRIDSRSPWFKSRGVAYLIADPRFCVPWLCKFPKECKIGNRSYFKLRKED